MSVMTALAEIVPVAGTGRRKLDALMKRGTDFLGCEVAIMGGAMSWVSERNLVAALERIVTQVRERAA